MMRKLFFVLPVFISALAAYCIYIWYPGRDPSSESDPWKECDRGINQIAVGSPDQKWTARGITLGCGSMAAAVDWGNIVIVKSGMEPSLGDEVLEGHWGTMDSAKLVWKDVNHLQITLPIDALIYMQKSVLGDVAVEIKFDPDDPAARETFLREREEWLAKRNSQ